MKTVLQALIDELHYPISVGYVENVIIRRSLNADEQVTYDIMDSSFYKGALADCLCSLVQAVNFSEADKSVGSLSDKDKERILFRANKLYNEIGEEEVVLEKTPTVYFLG